MNSENHLQAMIYNKKFKIDMWMNNFEHAYSNKIVNITARKYSFSLYSSCVAFHSSFFICHLQLENKNIPLMKIF